MTPHQVQKAMEEERGSLVRRARCLCCESIVPVHIQKKGAARAFYHCRGEYSETDNGCGCYVRFSKAATARMVREYIEHRSKGGAESIDDTRGAIRIETTTDKQEGASDDQGKQDGGRSGAGNGGDWFSDLYG
jgi:hypothetical protein